MSRVHYKGTMRISTFGDVTIVSSSDPNRGATVYYGPRGPNGCKDPADDYASVCDTRMVCGRQLSWAEWGWLLSEQGPLMVHCGLWQPDPYMSGEYCC